MMSVLVIALLGLCLGSFASLIAWRWPRRLPWVNTRSQCPACGHALAPRDLMPVLSWVMARGTCRYCVTPISPLYPILELVSAFICVMLYLAIGWQWILLPALIAVPLILAGGLIFCRRN